VSHTLIVGTTESGKTTLAKQAASMHKAAGTGVIVFDPLRSGGWQADAVYHSLPEFQRAFWASQRCAVFIDEAGSLIDEYGAEYYRILCPMATLGRHGGHAVTFISQRVPQLPRTLRDQCRHLFLFALSRYDAQEICRDFRCESLADIRIPLGTYYYITRNTEPVLGKVF
jgi:hypothetical protein